MFDTIKSFLASDSLRQAFWRGCRLMAVGFLLMHIIPLGLAGNIIGCGFAYLGLLIWIVALPIPKLRRWRSL